MFAGALIIIIGFFVLALDLSMLYNRKMELQNVADTAALAAAHELDGTNKGILNAIEKASDRFTAASPAGVTYKYGKSITWAELAIEFGSTPDGPWRSASDAKTQPDGLLYVKLDTSGLGSSYGQIKTLFLQLFANTSTASTGARAVAGRSAIKVTPLGICAMREEEHRNHSGELEEYGFRRGVSYNLLDLNRVDDTVGKTFIVNPLATTTPITDVATLAPFVCTGTMAMARLTGGGKVTVSPSFPISTLFSHLNSRFGNYTASIAPCDARSAPADTNVKEYTYNAAGLWMKAAPLGQSATLLRSDSRRWTVTGPDTTPAGTTAGQYGVLWAYAKAVPYTSYEQAGSPEPAGGYTTYDTSAWSTLYNPGKPETSTTIVYPPGQDTPYSYTGATTFSRTAPTGNKSVAHRRVLNLPLLECPVSGNKATVLGIGKFFMPVTATSTALHGEFAGLVSDQALGTQVVLYP
jgi:hypothetical protein